MNPAESHDGDSPAPHAIMVQVPEQGEADMAETIGRLQHSYPDSSIVLVVPVPSRKYTRAAFRSGAWDVLDRHAPDIELATLLIEAAQSAPDTPQRNPQMVQQPDDARLHSARECVAQRPATDHPGDRLNHDLRTGQTHRRFLETLAIMRDARQCTSRTVALVQFDLDRFHECNERGSPAYGDRVLAWFERLIRQASRPHYHTVRFQSDQFIAVLPDVDEADAIGFAEECRRLMQGQPITLAGVRMDLTATAGIVVSSPGCDETPHQLLQRARVVLSYGKQQGGNRVMAWSQVMNDPLSAALRRPVSVHQTSHWIARLRQHLRSMHMESTQALVSAIDARDPYTRTHSQAVASYAEWVARRMDFGGARLDALRAAALLHDVGKIGVPDAILTKPGPLTAEEFQAVKRHPETALDILRNVSFLADVQPMILHHHERYDGQGYPFGLCGDQIPIGARIIAVADALDTMLSPRTYKDAYSIDRVRQELQRSAGGQFDPAVTAVVLRLLDEEPQRLSVMDG